MLITPAATISEEVSVERMVKESHVPAMHTMMAMEMKDPPQPGAIRSNA